MEPGVIAAIGAAGTWAMSSVVMASQLSRVDAPTISAIRLVCGSAFLVAVLVLTGEVGELGTLGVWNAGQLVLGAAIGLGIGDTIYVASLGILGAARAFTVSLGLFTVLTYVLSVALLGEDVTAPVAAGSALVLVSVYLVSLKGKAGKLDVAQPRGLAGPPLNRRRRLQESGAVRGLLLVGTVAVCWSIATVWLRHVAVSADAIAVGAVRIPAAALMVGALVGLQRNSGIRRWTIAPRTMMILALTGIGGTGFGSLLYIYAIQEAGAGRTAVLSALSPLFALPLGAIFLKEPITGWVAFGTGLAVVGIALLSV